jgi:hypothetical protein
MRARQRHFTARDIGARVVLDSRYIQQSNSTIVSTWSDRSGNAYNATQAISTKEPTFQTNQIGGNGAVLFDGSNDSLQAASVVLPTYTTSIVVQKSTRTSTAPKFWFEQGPSIGSSNGMLFNGTYWGAWAFYRNGAYHDGPTFTNFDWIGNDWAIASLTYDGVGTIYKNGEFITNATNQGTARTNSDVTAALNIAARNQGSVFLNGNIGQILIITSALSNSARKRVEHAYAFSFKIACN